MVLHKLLSLMQQPLISKGVDYTYTVWDRIIQIEYFLVMFLRVPSIDSTCFPHTQGLQGIIFFSLVLILRISTYMRIQGDKKLSDLRIFFGACFTFTLVYCNLYHVSHFTQKTSDFYAKLNVSNLYVLNLYQFQYKLI